MVSIIIPCYNAASFIEKTIQSCLNQTYKDVEIIIIDDGSSDNSVEFANQLTIKENKIILYQQINQGSCVARNEGLRLAKGQYVFFLDADDILVPDALEQLLIGIESFDACFGDAYKMYENGILEPTNKAYSNQMPCLSVVVNAPFCGTVLIKTSSIKVFWEPKYDYVDEFYFFAKNASLGMKFNKIEKHILYYRQHQTLTRKSVQIEGKSWLESCTNAYMDIFQSNLNTVDRSYQKVIAVRLFLLLLVQLSQIKDKSNHQLMYLVSQKINFIDLCKSFFNKRVNTLMNINLHLYYFFKYIQLLSKKH